MMFSFFSVLTPPLAVNYNCNRAKFYSENCFRNLLILKRPLASLSDRKDILPRTCSFVILYAKLIKYCYWMLGKLNNIKEQMYSTLRIHEPRNCHFRYRSQNHLEINVKVQFTSIFNLSLKSVACHIISWSHHWAFQVRYFPNRIQVLLIVLLSNKRSCYEHVK